MKTKIRVIALPIILECFILALLSACGSFTDQSSTNRPFKNQQAISAGPLHIVGLHKNGTVTAALPDNLNLDIGQFDVSKWEDIVSVGAGGEVWAYNLLTAGLKNDGTVVYTHSLPNLSNERFEAASSWKNITAISVGAWHIVGLQKDGTVVVAGVDESYQSAISAWRDIVAISAGVMHTVGLKKDGTVVAVGNNENHACDVADWNDIVAISAGNDHTVGLRADGTVLAIGKNNVQQCNVSAWKDIVAISAGFGKTVGIKKDGTVISTDQQASLSGWTDIVQVSCSISTIGLKKNGTVEQYDLSFSDLSDWKNIGIPK